MEQLKGSHNRVCRELQSTHTLSELPLNMPLVPGKNAMLEKKAMVSVHVHTLLCITVGE